MLSPELDQTLRRALALANERGHEYATLEHLLLALTEDQDAVAALRSRNIDLDRLKRDLIAYIENPLSSLVRNASGDARPTVGFQRVLQRASFQVQASGHSNVTGADLVAPLTSGSPSYAAELLQEQNLSRANPVTFITHNAVCTLTT
jgi:ATP-dependent Clp protease ATP-binding subunit ClpA